MAGSAPGDESPRDRKRLARQAGLVRLSFISALAGVLFAYGAFAVLAAVAHRSRHQAGEQRLVYLGDG